MLRPSFVFAVLLFPFSAISAETIFSDDFIAQSLNGRNLSRGDWKINDGQALCLFDQDLYKKHNDHGPMVMYKSSYRDATVLFQFKPTDCTHFNIVHNEVKGHIFRIIWSKEKGGAILHWKEDHKSAVLSTAVPPFISGEWLSVSSTFKGDSVSVSFNQGEPVVVKHPSYDQEKTSTGITFTGGQFAVRSFTITK